MGKDTSNVKVFAGEREGTGQAGNMTSVLTSSDWF